MCVPRRARTDPRPLRDVRRSDVPLSAVKQQIEASEGQPSHRCQAALTSSFASTALTAALATTALASPLATTALTSALAATALATATPQPRRPPHPRDPD